MAKETIPSDKKGLRFLIRALRYRNYRLFFGGQGISLIGTWMTRVATGWLVYRLTDSALLLGIVSFASQIPAFVLSPLAGVLVDRWNRHKALVVTQILAMIQSLLLAILALTGVIRVWHVIALNLFQGFINTFDIPLRQSFVIEMVEDKKDLSNAIALNSSMFNGARLIGPSLAGLLIAWVGEGYCFLADGLSYIAVIAALLAMKIKPRDTIPGNGHVLEGLKEGYNYAFGFAPIKAILFLIGLVSFVGFPYLILMPVFARDLLHGGPNTLGFLMGAVGMGALCGAVYMASRKTVVGLGKVMAVSVIIFGIGIILFSLSRNFYLSLVLLLFTGFGMMVQMASANTLLQTIVEDDKRGRVMSFYAMAFMGMTPFGSLLAGSLADKIGAPATNIIGGAFCILGAVIFARNLPRLRQMVQPIYEKMGIVPQVANGLQSATRLTSLSDD